MGRARYDWRCTRLSDSMLIDIGTMRSLRQKYDSGWMAGLYPEIKAISWNMRAMDPGKTSVTRLKTEVGKG